jgi:hypothetical protein
MLSSRKAAAALLAASALLLAGCNNDTREADSATKPSILELMAKDAEGTFRQSVDKTQQAKSVHFTMAGTSAGQQVNGSGDMAFGPQPAFEMTMGAAGQTITARLLGSVMYMQVPAAQRSALGGKSWLKMDLAAISKGSGVNADQLTRQLKDADPSQQMKRLLDTGKLTAVGEETIDGAKTVHYSGVIPLDAYLKQYDSGLKSKAEQEMRRQGVTEVKTDFWIDEQYQPRRCHIVAGPTDMTVNYTDYGKPVNVVAPPASETTDYSALLRGLKRPTA